MRSSWRWSFASSPEIRAPRRSGSERSLLSRSRRRISSSAAIREEAEDAGDVVAQVGARDDRVQVAEAVVGFGEAEVLGKLLARGLLHDARSGEGEQGARLGDRHVSER